MNINVMKLTDHVNAFMRKHTDFYFSLNSNNEIDMWSQTDDVEVIVRELTHLLTKKTIRDEVGKEVAEKFDKIDNYIFSVYDNLYDFETMIEASDELKGLFK